ncbi:MAG: hypothetical protein FWG65_13390 [Turicibacter sp.]|nr:hypothetical protein [Turicibacter sp.]
MRQIQNLFKKLPRKLPVLLWIIYLILQTFAPLTVQAETQIEIIVPHTSILPERIEEPPTPPELFPVSVTETIDERGRHVLIMHYELTRAENPEHISRETLHWGGYLFELAFITRDNLNNVELKSITEVIERQSPSNDIEYILSLLSPQIDFNDGLFTGVLDLDVNSIRVSEAGRTSNSRVATVTREFPNLPDRDVALIPRTVVEGGVTYSLSDVRWTATHTSEINYTGIGERFTAHATYSGRVTTTTITGFNVTAEYNGLVSFLNTDILGFTATFQAVRPLETDEIFQTAEEGILETSESLENPEKCEDAEISENPNSTSIVEEDSEQVAENTTNSRGGAANSAEETRGLYILLISGILTILICVVLLVVFFRREIF